ncbi:MAG TPA: ATP-binding cassette domain-containing protein [Candidatus Luteococcus avicola]|nr:ATP-binding cassette domain-containing protein [Candidatus Luteococcus avicola]
MEATGPAAYLELREAGKSYGNVDALRGVNLVARAGEVTCVLGDNGAGKSTLIKIIAGLHQHSSGTLLVDGRETRFASPRDAQTAGISTVFQDLALTPLMAVWRNFFLGNEITHGLGRMNIAEMKRITGESLLQMGIDIPDLETPVGSLSGGQRQCVAIARALHFGAKVLILDEPTAALGVKQSGVVLKQVARARDAGIAVVFITHNPNHAWLVGDHFVVLALGRVVLDGSKQTLTLEQLTQQMAGGAELDELAHELSA